jgi:hypothetical protein
MTDLTALVGRLLTWPNHLRLEGSQKVEEEFRVLAVSGDGSKLFLGDTKVGGRCAVVPVDQVDLAAGKLSPHCKATLFQVNTTVQCQECAEWYPMREKKFDLKNNGWAVVRHGRISECLHCHHAHKEGAILAVGRG